jgi:serine/threonine protein kinase
MPLPTHIGHYVLEREIGSGASSLVWLGRHEHLSEHQVAIKLSMSQDREAVRRFKREAAIAARLHHEHIPRFYDFGFLDPYHFTILEYIEGTALRTILERRGSLPLEEALAIFRQIGTALDYAHSLNIVHRDVAPGNILIADRSRKAFLTDFGIAREPRTPITVAQAFMGTPGYLSPEHSDSATAVTHLSDIFCLGVLLYEMISGESPWDDPPGLRDGIAFTPPRSLKERGVEGLPSDVDRVLRTLLALEPSRRFPSARAAVAELDRIFAHHNADTQVVVPGPDGTTTEFRSGGVEFNAVETELGADLLRAPIDRAHQRAEDLRNPLIVGTLLDEWSAKGRLRQDLLGRRARLHKVTSRNVYFYRVLVLYEWRYAPETKEEPDKHSQTFPLKAEADRWDVKLPVVKDFVNAVEGHADIPGSYRVIQCTTCGGEGYKKCKRCQGQGRIRVPRPVGSSVSAPGAPALPPTTPPAPGAQPSVVGNPNAPGAPGSITPGANPAGPAAGVPQRPDTMVIPCPDCQGRGAIDCSVCASTGRMVQHKLFRWKRDTEVFRGNDDLPNLDEDWLARVCKAEVIYNERQEGGIRPEWQRIPVLKDLIKYAHTSVGSDARIVLIEVNISFIPVTDLVFDLGRVEKKGMYKLSLYGFENLIPPDWRFLDWERVVFAAASIFMLATMLILGFFAFT